MSKQNKKDKKDSRSLIFTTRKEGYVLIEEVESHLHRNTNLRMRDIIRSIYVKFKVPDQVQIERTVTLFVASGKRIDKKIDNINKRIQKNTGKL